MEGSRNPRRLSAGVESRRALLAKMREAKAKGEKLRIEEEEHPVYDTVDEAEYAKVVQKRLEDDWIVDDEGLGYADDGREIFDDNDEDEENEARGKAKGGSASQSKTKKSRLNPDIRAGDSCPLRPVAGRDIRSLFAATSAQKSAKRRKESVGSSVDTNLDDLLAELESSTPAVQTSTRAHIHKSKSRKRVLPPTPSVSNGRPIVPPENSIDIHPSENGVGQNSLREAPEKRLVSSLKILPTQVPTPRAKNPFSADKPQPSKANGMVVRQPHTNSPASEVNSSSHEHELSATDFEEDFDMPHSEDVSVKVKQESSHSPDKRAILAKPELSTGWLAAEKQAIWDADDWTGEVDAEVPVPLENKDAIHFFWFDAYEDAKQMPGAVYMFGKIRDETHPGKFRSCCLRIKDLERQIYLLPRGGANEEDSRADVKEVYPEFREITKQYKIPKFRCKVAHKRYAFEYADVPANADYLEVRYNASYPALPADLQGKTFSRVFGTNTSFLENFILELQLHGPCWLEVKQASPVQPQFSWCSVDFEVVWQSGSSCPIDKLSSVLDKSGGSTDGVKLRKLLQPPTLCLVSINIKSVTEARASHSEIVSIGMLIDQNYSLDRPSGKSMFDSHYLVLAPPKDAALPYDLRTKLPTFGPQYSPPPNAWPCNSAGRTGSSGSNASQLCGGVDVEPSERALLGRFLTRIHKIDPDLIIGHDLWGNEIELLIQRLTANKVAHWHRIGRLRRSAHFSVNAANRSWLIRHSMPGRLVCDTRLSARELIRSRTYSLSDLANQVLVEFDSTRKNDAAARRQVPQAVITQLVGSSFASSLADMGVEITDLEIDSADLRGLFATSDLIRQLIDFCLSDAHLALRLAHQLQVLPLAMQITTICGNLLSRTLAGGRAERNEFLLLHTFTHHGYLVPDAPYANRNRITVSAQDEWDVHVDNAEDTHVNTAPTSRRKPAYAGGLVLEPKKGFYDKYILLLDFNSLYPSIIQEFNICFTTVDRKLVTGTKSEPTIVDNEGSNEVSQLDTLIGALLSSVQGDVGHSNISEHIRLPTDQLPGLLPAEIRRLVESRREVKKLIAAATANNNRPDPVQMAQWNTRQAALKLTANSVYGCLGFAASRFCARGLAALVTGLGRAVLVNTRDLVEAMNFEVIYGDTDSIMINTNTTDLLAALTIGEKVRQEVNKHYRLLELDTDGVYASMLLLAKKKYAALAIINPVQWADALRASKACGAPANAIPQPATKQEMKGLDIVRRDWSTLAITVGKRCVSALLSGDPKDVILERIHTDLTETARKARDGELPLSDFVITKMLTKDPEEYTDAKSLPHVQVALRLNSGGIDSKVADTTGGTRRRFRAGDTVDYIICNDGSGHTATQRGYSPAELAVRSQKIDQPQLKVDVTYYLAHQIHPVICRLVAPIEGTSPARIADCLGLDPTVYRHQAGVGASEEEENELHFGIVNGGSGRDAIWPDVEPLTIPCPRNCGGTPIEIKICAFSPSNKSWSCPKCSHNILRSVESMRLVANRLMFISHQLIARYELGWVCCEDPACGLATRTVLCPPSSVSSNTDSDGLWARGGRPLCPGCGGQALLKPIYSESQLYRQLCFFRYLVSPNPNMESETQISPQIGRLLLQCRNYLDRVLSHSGYAMVDLSQLFSGLRTLPAALGLH
ncbi:unnamed protein product [Calicophoron daubneyi]|uniref:DNA polymerase n=1 Tax=Calicophoron daubneyi TaxID=300641 RepID=A0AAV2TAX3_CALDB